MTEPEKAEFQALSDMVNELMRVNVSLKTLHKQLLELKNKELIVEA